MDWRSIAGRIALAAEAAVPEFNWAAQLEPEETEAVNEAMEEEEGKRYHAAITRPLTVAELNNLIAFAQSNRNGIPRRRIKVETIGPCTVEHPE